LDVSIENGVKIMLGVAIIGTGVICERHIEAYLAHQDRCAIRALCDLFPEKAEKLKEKYGLAQAQVYASYEEILPRGDIRLVSICTPPFTHAPAAIALMGAGKHVVTEKPMAASLEECDAMLAAQRASGVYLGVVSQNRFQPDNWKLHELLRSGMAGRPLFGQVESYWFRGHSYYDMWWRGTWEKEGGGCTLNHAVHQIDLLNWMMGAPRTVTAVLGNVAHDNAEVEDVAAAVLTYECGALVTLTASLVTHGEGQRLDFQCERAGISSPFGVRADTSRPDGFPQRDADMEKELTALWESITPPSQTGHVGQIGAVVEYLEPPEHTQGIKAASAPLPTGLSGGEDGRLAIEVITAIYESAFTGRTVALPLAPDDPFYTKEGMLGNVRKFHEKPLQGDR
jgi:predicted dehydrogenase